MRVVAWTAAGVLSLSACGGSTSTATTDVVDTATDASTAVDPVNQTAETLPALLDPSTDLDAIDRPIVLWFWSPG